MCHHKSTCKINQRMAGLFLRSKWLPRTRIFLLMGQCAAHNEGTALKHVHLFYLLSISTRYMKPLDHDTVYCTKWALQRCVQHFLLQETDCNVPTKDIRMWNILDAMWGHSAAWKSITTAIIQNVLAKCGCSTARSTPAMKTKTAKWRNCKAILIAPIFLGSFLTSTNVSPP